MAEIDFPDPCRMFEQACAFSDCAKYCEIEPNNIEYRTNSHMASGIVNSAFACEIFIKSLLVYSGIAIQDLRGHRLDKLWDKFKEKYPDSVVSIESGVQVIFNSPNTDLFRNLLEIMSNSFDEWRYIYEKRSATLNPHFLRIFRNALREECCYQLYKQSWREYIKTAQKS
jgi:predicted metalloprotease